MEGKYNVLLWRPLALNRVAALQLGEISSIDFHVTSCFCYVQAFYCICISVLLLKHLNNKISLRKALQLITCSKTQTILAIPF